MFKFLFSLLLLLSFFNSQASVKISYKAVGKNATFDFELKRVTYNGESVIHVDGKMYAKYGIFYKGGMNHRSLNTLDGNSILSVKCNWKSKVSKSECTRVKFNADSFHHYTHKSSDLTLNERFITRSGTKKVKINSLQPDYPIGDVIFDSSSLIAFTPMLNLSKIHPKKIIYTNYKERLAKSKIWLESEKDDIQVIRLTPIHPTAEQFKTLVIKITYDKKRKVVTSFVQKIPVFGNLTIKLKSMTGSYESLY